MVVIGLFTISLFIYLGLTLFQSEILGFTPHSTARGIFGHVLCIVTYWELNTHIDDSLLLNNRIANFAFYTLYKLSQWAIL